MSNPTPTDITTGGVDPVPTDSHTYTVNGNSADYGWGLTQDGQGVVVWKGDWFQILSQGTSIAFNDQIVSTDYLFSGGAANNGSGSTVNHADNNSHGPILPAPAAEHQMEHIKATIVGADSLKEGETQSYKIQLSQAAEHDTYYTINVQDGSAHWVNGNTPGVDHQDIMWGGHFSVNIGVGPHAMHLYDVYGQVPNSTDANAGYRPAVGPSDASWDFSTFQNGQATGNTIVVKVPAGQTCSDSFDIKSWNEKITVDNQISDASAGQQGDEHFSLQIGQITGAGDCEEICGDGKGVTIQHNSEIHHVSPIALDLNGDGKIGVTGQTTSIDKSGVTSVGHTVSFDIDGDGVKDQIEWLDGMSDGLLVDMTKVGTDGSIDGKALFGDEGGKYANGYEKLALHDANGDGVISGEELKGLGIWIDNGDAVLQAGEMKSAAELHITSISADMHITYDNSGHALMQSAANIDGKTVLTEDVWFAKTDAAAHSPADVAKAVDPVHAIDDHHQDLAHAA